jgi:hypothetical protein
VRDEERRKQNRRDDQSQTIPTAAPGLGLPMRRPILSRLPFERLAIGLSATCLAMVVLNAATANTHAGTHYPIWVHGTSVVFGLCGWSLVFLRMWDETTFGLDPLPVTIL